ncbi:hypothetical protein [Nocardia aurea]|uniref:hypothetical protein n=1 Tax=Nocardia aurea TaxID=2144174 RepID=UPI00339F055C
MCGRWSYGGITQISRDTVTVTRVQEQLEDIRRSIGDLDGRTIASRLVSIGVDIGALTVRQDAMERHLGMLQSDVGTLKSDVGTLKLDVGTLKSDVGTLKLDVGTLKLDVGTLKSDVGTLKSDVGTLKSDVADLKTGMAQILVILQGRSGA